VSTSTSVQLSASVAARLVAHFLCTCAPGPGKMQKLHISAHRAEQQTPFARLHHRLLILAAVLCALSSNCSVEAARPRQQQQQQATVIVQYKPSAVRSMSAASDSSIVAIAASDAATATARQWGASAEKQASIAAIASAAATAIPAVASMTSAVSEAAARSGIRVVGQTNYATVLHGAAIRTQSPTDARRLRNQLERNANVQQVWFAVS